MIKANVTRTTIEEVEKHWGFTLKLPMYRTTSQLYIECYPLGRPRWKSKLLFTQEEIDDNKLLNVIE